MSTKPYQIKGSVVVGLRQYTNCIAHLTDKEVTPYLKDPRFKAMVIEVKTPKQESPTTPEEK